VDLWTTVFTFPTGLREARGERVFSGARNVPILKTEKIGEGFQSVMSGYWRIRIRFQEGKFLFTKWKGEYTVLFEEWPTKDWN
jgi:hypothetical protein